ncbi:MAG: hypothetical protein K2W85_11835 [Phycisphaerales bacterium]|nr:hypothetical protein [Phycisphaerales bacterium]
MAEKKTTSTKRLSALGVCCVEQLAKSGLTGAELEITIDGGGRPKDWDVAWKWAGKYRLVISLKSILKNLGGTVPNRIDDLMGETTNIQLYSPEIVTGYVVVIDATGCGEVDKKLGQQWASTLSDRLRRLSGRRAPYWSPGTFEAHAVIVVDFSTGPRIVSGEEQFAAMFDQLAQEVRVRNPGIDGAA